MGTPAGSDSSEEGSQPPKTLVTQKGSWERACLAPKKDIEQSTLLSDDIEEGEIEGILSVEKQNGNAEEEIPETNKSESEKAEGQDMEETLLTSPAQPEKSMVLLETEQTLFSGKETENGKSDEEYEREWSDVTPGKASRSPNKKILEAENVSIVSNSRFSVLSPTGEDGEEVEESAETNEVGVGSSELIEKSSDLKNSRKEVKEKEVIIVRQSLPRGSKDKHKFLSDITAQKAKEAAPALSKKIIDITGARGCIDLGIPITATVEFAVQKYRSRRHRVAHMNDIENEILKLRLQGLALDTDIRLWKGVGDSFKPQFNTQQTWQLTRLHTPRVNWSKAVWFRGATPRYSVLTWIAVHDRLATRTRIQRWSPQADAQCVLCSGHLETREHLFFSCSYSKQIWKGLTANLLGSRYTEDWNCILEILAGSGGNNTEMFLLRYAFQSSIHTIWRERNGRKHGEPHQTSTSLIRFIDKGVRNRISSLRMGGSRRFTNALTTWFATRG
ncbi:hypothetical protein Bca52824_009394 [Brassica carinata]|uniref:Reverse transcriptase zinc-binding domain-containing protein n=1 Tax=Brassica carinata TaxID=52824 RepID=A0A8X7WBR5_BRACI|nr:hypothetical protein Bca52824_009394 [Brassica carinata]